MTAKEMDFFFLVLAWLPPTIIPSLSHVFTIWEGPQSHFDSHWSMLECLCPCISSDIMVISPFSLWLC